MSGRLLFCSSERLTRTLGASKVPIELADAMRQVGWGVDLVGPEDYIPKYNSLTETERKERADQELRNLIVNEGACYDVVDYQIQNLPFARATFPKDLLMVARTPILLAHLDHVRFPQPLSLRRVAGKLFLDRARQRRLRAQINKGLKTAREADLVVVNNDEDRGELVRRGLVRDRIRMIPLGLSDGRLGELATDPCVLPSTPTVAFVGTFDWRKGAADFPDLIERVRAEVPAVQFRLLGTRGMFQEERDIRRLFPSGQQKCLDIVPSFSPETLPSLLHTCSGGVFPSYLEGFGFGVLEMLAASLPVVAYDAPGPPVMLPREWLVRPGDTVSAAEHLVTWLQNPALLREARLHAHSRAQQFTWARTASLMHEAYCEFGHHPVGNHESDPAS